MFLAPLIILGLWVLIEAFLIATTNFTTALITVLPMMLTAATTRNATVTPDSPGLTLAGSLSNGLGFLGEWPCLFYLF